LLTDVRDGSLINPVRKGFFGDARPASSLFGVKEPVVPGMKIEIEAAVGLRNR
jgi:2-iminobutanoate/2-iminopropanoate deaminase